MKQPTNMLALVQSEIMREADGYSSVVAQAADDFAAKVGTLEARTAALQWKLEQATAAFVNATGENPNLNAVDMVVLASLSRSVMEDYWVGQKFGQSALPLLEAHRKLEQSAWSVVEGVLAVVPRDELRKLIADWFQKYPNQRHVGAVRLREFTGILGNKAVVGLAAKPNSVLNLLDIDPLSGIDPAVRALEQTRYMAERMMYYAERAPMLIRWQVELLTYGLAGQPAAQQMLSNVASLSRSAAIFAETAQQLPSLVTTQREAAINQLFAGIATERSIILSNLNSQEATLRELLPKCAKPSPPAATWPTRSTERLNPSMLLSATSLRPPPTRRLLPPAANPSTCSITAPPPPRSGPCPGISTFSSPPQTRVRPNWQF